MALLLREETTLKGVVGKLETETGVLGRIWKYELQAGAAVLVVGFLIGFFAGNWWTAGVGGVLLFLGASHALKRGENRTDIGRFQGGAAGEEQVTDQLKRGLPDSYFILNDVTVRAGSRKAQNDHILLGPNGIFVIETKAYSGTLSGKATDETLTQVKDFKGKKTETQIKNPVPQNEYHCDVVREKMQEGGFAVDDLHSIIVFTSRWARIRIEDCPVPVLKPEMLCSTVKGTGSKYSYERDWLLNLARFLAPDARIPEDASGS